MSTHFAKESSRKELSILEVNCELARIKNIHTNLANSYSGVFSWMRLNLRDDDLNKLMGSLDRLNDLKNQESVRVEMAEVSPEVVECTTYASIMKLKKGLFGFGSNYLNVHNHPSYTYHATAQDKFPV